MIQINQRDLLMVVDMQNVYLPGQPWGCERMKEAIAYIKRMLDQFPKDQIVFTRYLPSEHPKGVWREYNIVNEKINKNDWMNDYVQELKGYCSSSNLYSKSTYSCCKNKELQKKMEQYDRVFLTGVVAECCVLSTVYELIDLGKKIVYLKKGIAGQNREKEKAAVKVLEELSPLHVIFGE